MEKVPVGSHDGTHVRATYDYQPAFPDFGTVTSRRTIARSEIPRERHLDLCSRLSNDRGVAMCREAGLDPLNSAFSVPREGTLRPVRSTRTRAFPPFVRAVPLSRPFGGCLPWQAVLARVQEVSKAGVTTCDSHRSVNRCRSRQPGNGMRVRCSNSPYSFILSLTSVFPCFGTGNRRFQAIHMACRRALRRVPGTNKRIP